MNESCNNILRTNQLRLTSTDPWLVQNHNSERIMVQFLRTHLKTLKIYISKSKMTKQR